VFCDQNKVMENVQNMCQSAYFYFIVKYVDLDASDEFLAGNSPCSKS
jgi:hypothetical protein